MIKIAHILPTKYLRPLNSFIPAGIHLLLTHQVLKDAKYTAFYKKRKERGDYLILDNSAFEFGNALAPELLTKAIVECAPDEFILPDVLSNKNTTIKKTNEFVKSASFRNLKFMAVVQGNTLEDWIDCYKYFSNQDYVYSIGFGAIYAKWDIFGFKIPNNYVSGREFLIQTLYKKKLLNLNKSHHLLGVGDSGHLELRELSKYKWIRSCDTSAAYIHGKEGVRLSKDGRYAKIQRKIDFSDNFDKKNLEFIIHNMNIFYEAGGGEINKLHRGVKISFEGIDGSGKTTQICLIQQYLKKRGYRVFKASDNSDASENNLDGKILALLKQEKDRFFRIGHPTTESLLLAGRATYLDIVETQPKLNSGYVVLADRDIDTFIAYGIPNIQNAYPEKKPEEIMNWITSVISIGRTVPDLTILFRPNLDEFLPRATVGLYSSNQKDNFNRKDWEFMEHVAICYEELRTKFPERIKILDISGKNKQEVFKDLLAIIVPFLEKYGVTKK